MTSKRNQPSPKEETKEPRPKRPVGRPPLELPDPIPDTPENIARVVLNTKPKKRGEWRFEKRRARKSDK
ncbi:MAG: hypothetical protein OXI24_15900 [Candidatus Poribacteria bacterium]|nr:hypothetical protein [Candidatus Poribacteria bacterium]